MISLKLLSACHKGSPQWVALYIFARDLSPFNTSYIYLILFCFLSKESNIHVTCMSVSPSLPQSEDYSLLILDF